MPQLRDFRQRRMVWHRNRWQERDDTPLVRGFDAHRMWDEPDPMPVRTLGTEGAHPAGACRWPELPPKTVHIEFTNRDGQLEKWDFVDPAKVTEPGAVFADPYPRNGQGQFVCRNYPVVGGALGEQADFTIPGRDMVRTSEVKAANPTKNYALGDGWNLRALAQDAVAVAAGRGGSWPYVVMDEPGWYYLPDFLSGWHSGCHMGPGQVEVAGFFGTGPDVKVRMVPGLVPSRTVMVGSLSQLKNMRRDASTSSHTATVFFADQVPRRVIFANFTGAHSTGLVDPDDGAELFWTGIKINAGPQSYVAERMTFQGFSAGWNSFPPGETDTIASSGATSYGMERDCLFDGRDPDGVRRAVSMTGHNGSRNNTTAVVTPAYGFQSERNLYRYGRAGMQTYWLCDGVVSAFDEVYSTAVGSPYAGGTGLNLEETKGKIRLFHRRVTMLGKHSDDTTNPDRTTNNSQWCSIIATEKFGGDAGRDVVIFEPRWASRDYRALDGAGKLVIAMPLGYEKDAGYPIATATRPMVLMGQQEVTTGDNYDVALYMSTSTGIGTGTRKFTNVTAQVMVTR